MKVLVTTLHTYEVDLDGTADPEQVSDQSLWLRLTEGMEPAQEEFRAESLQGVEEISTGPRGGQ